MLSSTSIWKSNFSPFLSKLVLFCQDDKNPKSETPVIPEGAGFQIVSPNPHSSYLQGEERFQIETVSTRLELIRSFTGDNASSYPKCFLPSRFQNKTSHLFPLSGFLSATKIKVQKVKLPVTPEDAGFQIDSPFILPPCHREKKVQKVKLPVTHEDAGFQIVSPNPHQSYLQGEERSQIGTVSIRPELIRSFTGDNTSSQFALVVNLARQSSLRAKYSTRRTLVWNSRLHFTKIKVQKAKLPVTPEDEGFQIVSPNPHSSYLQGEERSQIGTVSTCLELIRFFTGDNPSSQFALVVNLARQSSLRAKYSTRRTLVWNSRLHLYFWGS
ncbi:hypothetical protein CDAR_109681 [Caerostris darwini]|uniref:Uncharacterized protein n=1 Tax=Caerostris darwini TaxID=1538125 RepID=A0AAV4SSY9_9ARAC|nr:hypothetical protein CDAR_109681 [Caerostris darwini]